MRKIRDLFQAVGKTAFKIRREDQRKLRIALQLIGQHRGLEGRRLEQQAVLEGYGNAEASNVVLAHRVAQVDVLGAGHIHEVRASPDHEHLPDLLLQRHLFQRLTRPLLAFLVEMDGAGLLKMLFRGTWHCEHHAQDEKSEATHSK